MNSSASHRLDHHKLRKLVLAKDLSGAQLAIRLGVSPQAAGRWLRGDSQPRLHRLVPLAEELGVSVDELFVESSGR